MDKGNADKSEHGMNGISSMEQMLDSLLSMDYIIFFNKGYRVGDPNYEEKQFYFQYLIEFTNNEQWILHHTTSIRDRILEQQWQSEHIKRLNHRVSKAYVVVPDEMSEREKRNAENYNSKIETKKIYSALDGVYNFSKMYQTIEHKAASLMENGQAKAKMGLHFETKLVDCLNNVQNMERWNHTSNTKVGYLYSLYCNVMNKFGVRPQELLSVSATSDIPKLPSGGNPKTDVLATIETTNGSYDFTISCKRSTADIVTIHEYTAYSFSKILNPDDAELLDLLIEFQTVGGVNSMTKESSDRLSEKMKVYSDSLCEWALAGVGGEGDPKIQWATHIITVNEEKNEYSISTIDEYLSRIKKSGIKGQFETPFQWTYPSGGKGKRIQLKMKMI
ncbi:MspI family type II restriction endonuclease [Butyrivibrio sp. AE2032]|uniref:MspI family type II restriction endonuclease n=1 Tax=Butyrivibrio sp. AE2032 TaxID=1458463 RepID=UPI00054FC3AB|nr:MspI family type II restriction endonuclease [Butyrivibrio sp. AE2032]